MNRPAEISLDVQAFLREKVPSYEHLESLLLLRNHRDRSFSLASIADLLRMPEAAVGEALDDLCREKLVEMSIGTDTSLFTYKPGNASLADLTDRLAQAKELHLLEVMKLMTSNSIDRVRTQGLHTFANAFLLGQKKEERWLK